MMTFDINLPGKAREHLLRLVERGLSSEACRAIQHEFLKPSTVNMISKDVNLVIENTK